MRWHFIRLNHPNRDSRWPRGATELQSGWHDRLYRQRGVGFAERGHPDLYWTRRGRLLLSRMRMMCIDYCSLTTAPRTRIFIQQRNDKWIKRKTHVRPGLHAIWLRCHGSIGQVGVDRFYCITIHELGFHLCSLNGRCIRCTNCNLH